LEVAVDDIELSEHIYEVLVKSVGRERMGQAISDLLDHKTGDHLLRRVVIFMAMIHAHCEGH
jgi:hypothetical protein